jgi:hypothetical protein
MMVMIIRIVMVVITITLKRYGASLGREQQPQRERYHLPFLPVHNIVSFRSGDAFLWKMPAGLSKNA